MLLICPYCKENIAAKLPDLPRLAAPEDYLLCYGCCGVSQLDNKMSLQKADESNLPDFVKREQDLFINLVQNAKFVHCPPGSLHQEKAMIEESMTLTCVSCLKEFEHPMPEPGEDIPEFCPDCPDLEKL